MTNGDRNYKVGQSPSSHHGDLNYKLVLSIFLRRIGRICLIFVGTDSGGCICKCPRICARRGGVLPTSIPTFPSHTPSWAAGMGRKCGYQSWAAGMGSRCGRRCGTQMWGQQMWAAGMGSSPLIVGKLGCGDSLPLDSDSLRNACAV